MNHPLLGNTDGSFCVDDAGLYWAAANDHKYDLVVCSDGRVLNPYGSCRTFLDDGVPSMWPQNTGLLWHANILWWAYKWHYATAPKNLPCLGAYDGISGKSYGPWRTSCNDHWTQGLALSPAGKLMLVGNRNSGGEMGP